ncbi:hypothetical protein [Agrococcus jejuensis]|uniref:Uncharacterized protein n=1 Tax=Agrococcus jejuensis TaxID=399736 RepID=A0A1G8FNG2_9MICO|nr:hypothetical protein [Agrococcus jejuensis]SDH83703.1 hypothetical protein SAMN04489720_2549 [Agrococcus jejuensis]
MRLRQRAVRGIAASAAAAALVVGLAGCVGGDTNDGPTGPNGYDLGATIGDDVRVWWDVSETTGTTDVILERAGESQPLGVCLGSSGTICVMGDPAVEPYVAFFGPQGAAAQMSFNGQVIDMAVVEGTPADGAGIYVAAGLPVDPSTLQLGFTITDAAGAVVWQQ